MADYDPIAAFLASMGAGTPGNGMPGGGVLGRQASGPGFNYGFTSAATPNSFTTMNIQPGIPNPLGLLGNLNPYARAAIAAAGVMEPTPTAANDQAPTNMWFQRPSGVGGMPGPSTAPTAAPYDPLSSIQAPAAPPMAAASPPAAQPERPVTKTPAARGSAAASPKKGIDPAKVDLGMNPRFTTVQYQVPNSTRNAPIYTALNLGGSS